LTQFSMCSLSGKERKWLVKVLGSNLMKLFFQ
jgi:hypothetical protein